MKLYQPHGSGAGRRVAVRAIGVLFAAMTATAIAGSAGNPADAGAGVAPPSATGAAVAPDRPPWRKRARDVLQRTRFGKVESTEAAVLDFGTQEEALEYSHMASAADPMRQARGASLEATQTWFYTEDETGEPEPVQIHLVNGSLVEVSGMLLEISENACGETIGRRYYHAILAVPAVEPGDERVLLARIPAEELVNPLEQCAVILEAW